MYIYALDGEIDQVSIREVGPRGPAGRVMDFGFGVGEVRGAQVWTLLAELSKNLQSASSPSPREARHAGGGAARREEGRWMCITFLPTLGGERARIPPGEQGSCCTPPSFSPQHSLRTIYPTTTQYTINTQLIQLISDHEI